MNKPSRVARLIEETNGRFFSISFIKRTDGTLRDMNCRTKVTKHLRGGELPFNPKDYNLRIVFDLQKKQYRSISLDSVKSFRCGNTVVNFE